MTNTVMKLRPTRDAQPPAYLGDPEREFWRRIREEYDIVDNGGLAFLEQACRNLKTVRECRERVEKDGLLVGAREHPLLKVWRDAEKMAFSALRALNLDLEPLRDRPGRPPGSRRL